MTSQISPCNHLLLRSSCCTNSIAMAEQPVSPVERLMKDLYVVVSIGLATPLNLAVFRAGIEAQLARHPYFRSIQVTDDKDDGGSGTPRWVPTTVNVDDHIVVVPALDSAADPDKAVEDYLASLSTLPMDHTRPPWDFHFLDVTTSEAASTVALRVHHALADGMALITLLISSSRSAADPAKAAPLPPLPARTGAVYAPPRQQRRPGSSSSSALGLPLVLAWVWSYLVLAWHTLVDVATFVNTIFFRGDTETLFKRANHGGDGADDSHRRMRFVHRTFSLDDVKFVKNAMNYTVNDVLIGITSAALSRYFFRRTGDTKTREIVLRSILPVNTRPAASLQMDVNMIETGKSNAVRWGNRLGYIILPFHLAMHDDPLEYVRKAKQVIDRKKNSLEMHVVHLSIDIVFKVFGPKAGAYIFNKLLRNTTMALSNLIGPPEQIELCGHPVAYIAPSVYGLQQAITVHYQSYNNTIKVVLAVDEAQFPDSSQLLDDFAECLKLTKDAAAKTMSTKMIKNE
ncbi:wax ester synthase/diacylglycerol acyltransferase 11-like [Miscanthus floridulus]|uniref:wax ester synthase/diacylglycerol acyltransferase 11-like n=1 Tax=Miscanthus floridulus TaxID=154761 RepID=UPI00345AB78F